ncbi:hypothetical protein GH714_041136 [Hevea brasiliensis]|uniref:MULE transposase domain-containing protein n=1 Tax=Hevea brasiliensis TaxID=3981 RepID=A0A6A6MVK7_HEVBR|nr:hypothetical protein GH714_041136 [Hevea brasiliensis]
MRGGPHDSDIEGKESGPDFCGKFTEGLLYTSVGGIVVLGGWSNCHEIGYRDIVNKCEDDNSDDTDDEDFQLIVNSEEKNSIDESLVDEYETEDEEFLIALKKRKQFKETPACDGINAESIDALGSSHPVSTRNVNLTNDICAETNNVSEYQEFDDKGFETPYTSDENDLVARDGNSQMFLIAWCIVEVENENRWRWFLERLFEDLNLVDGLGLTLVSGQQKGLAKAIRELVPNTECKNCARHIYANWKNIHRGGYKDKSYGKARSGYDVMISENLGFMYARMPGEKAVEVVCRPSAIAKAARRIQTHSQPSQKSSS